MNYWLRSGGLFWAKEGPFLRAGQRRGLYGFLAGFGDEIANFVLLAGYGGDFVGNGDKTVHSVNIGADHGEPLVAVFKSHDSFMAVFILGHEGV